MPDRIATSPLTGRVHAGRVNKAGNAFVGEKRDVTGDVLRAVIEKAEFHGGKFDIEGGGRKWVVTVTEVNALAATRPKEPTEARGDAGGGEVRDEAPSMVDQIRATTEYVSWFPINAPVRPCDQPGGCNGSNCLGCGEVRACGVTGCATDKEKNHG